AVATAASISAASPAAMAASTRPSMGLTSSKVLPELAARNCPSMSARPSGRSARARSCHVEAVGAVFVSVSGPAIASQWRQAGGLSNQRAQAKAGPTYARSDPLFDAQLDAAPAG